MLQQASLNGEKKTLLFDLGTLEHVGDLIGGDGFEFVVNIKEFKSFSKDLGTIICAGLRSYYDSVDKPYDFTEQDVKKWTKRISNMGEAIEILSAFHKAFKTDGVSGEGDDDTQGQATHNMARDNGHGVGGIKAAS